ncbi:helix-turn-helix domain-containing protein [Mucilaginibacter dorajii]|uniref:HTH araC/xylS-type domain-containing protein n=1 Tax=Mucilaginibacter dorajii TaxID=692994 RepID=A0ABP7QXN9_9SPHI|nr:AraC family transcriptional regulator [Mucilaginibacter dorajii]MCS3732388.1 AraC-like DNA-binding protein [Mucilaginibacter dorajii]
MCDNKNGVIKRSEEITKAYFEYLDDHLADIISGKATEMMQLSQIADALFLSHSHLTDTIQNTMGHHPCHFYDLKISDQAKKLITDTDYSIAEIAKKLTYDPSNFSKFFKKFTGQTPGEFRKQHKNQ